MKVSLGGKGGRVVRSLAAGKVTPLSAAGPSDVVAEIARVAEAHQPENGYGETAWNADSKTVYWVSADWTSTEEHDAAYADFAAIDGVDDVTGDAEAALPSGDGWAQVWPEERLGEAATPSERWSRLIGEMEESGELDREAPAPVVAAAPEPPSPLEQAFAVMGRLVDAVAARPQPPAPVVHVHNHDPDLSVNVHPAAGPHVSVTLPEQEPPQVTVENHNHLPGQEAPNVAVTVEAAEAPDVHVQVAAPEVTVEPPQVTVAAAQAPDVHVTVEQTRPGPVRLEIAEDGTRRFIPEDSEPEE